MKSIRVFLSENVQFLEVKFSIYLNRRVFVMYFVFSKVSYSPSEMHEHPHNESTVQDCAAAQYQVSIPDSFFFFFFQTPRCQVLNKLHENAFCSLHILPPYLMFYSTFCNAYTDTWGLGTFQYHLPTLTILPDLFTHPENMPI